MLLRSTPGRWRRSRERTPGPSRARRPSRTAPAPASGLVVSRRTADGASGRSCTRSRRRRNAITDAISSGWPTRRSGTVRRVPLDLLVVRPVRSAISRVIRVSMKPGATALTRIPKRPSSIASVRASPSMPAFRRVVGLATVSARSPTRRTPSLLACKGPSPPALPGRRGTCPQVGGDDEVQVLLAHLVDEVVADHSRRRDQHVQRAELVHGEMHRRLHLRAARHVALRRRLAALRRDGPLTLSAAAPRGLRPRRRSRHPQAAARSPRRCRGRRP